MLIPSEWGFSVECAVLYVDKWYIYNLLVIVCPHIMSARSCSPCAAMKCGNVIHKVTMFMCTKTQQKSLFQTPHILICWTWCLSYLSPHWPVVTLSWTDVHFLQIHQAGVKLKTQYSPDTVWSLWKKQGYVISRLLSNNSFSCYTTAHHETLKGKGPGERIVYAR